MNFNCKIFLHLIIFLLIILIFYFNEKLKGDWGLGIGDW